MPDIDRLPIKVVLKQPSDDRKPVAGGGDAKVFGDVTPGTRQQRIAELSSVGTFFQKSFSDSPGLPAVARLTIKPEAVAKSHRPTRIFNEETCPIIGSNRLGELYVSVLPEGLRKVSERMRDVSGKMDPNISTIMAIEPYRVSIVSGDALATGNTEASGPGYRLRLRLFRHPDDRLNRLIEAEVARILAMSGLPAPQRLNYAPGLSVYRIVGQNAPIPESTITRLANFVGTQSLAPFPWFDTVKTAGNVIGDLTAESFYRPVPGQEYPVVGLIDSGTDRTNSALQEWVVGRIDFVPPDKQNNYHGSFVAGLISQGRALNHQDPRFPEASCKVVDVAVLGNDGAGEDDLLIAIDQAMATYPDIKVWNMSLAQQTPCDDNEFSEFAAALDDRAITHNCLFVVAAGNHRYPRTWPPEDSIGDFDRVCPPSDAIHSLTVGSIAHLETPNSLVRTGEPSPFSRRGPGPAFSLKPEVSHYGGNCNAAHQHMQLGVISVDNAMHVVEDIGTSFATPLVSAIAGTIEHEMTVGAARPSSRLVKAMIVHSAFLRTGSLSTELVNYSGAGIPDNPIGILSCQQNSATLIFQIPANAKLDFGKRPFPMPKSLARSGSLKGEIFMTLLYDPPIDRQQGVEYCRTNVNASLGSIGLNDTKQKNVYTRQVPPSPKQHHNGLEGNLIEHGYKWSPIKLYYRKFTNGPEGVEWRLTLDVVHRSNFEPSSDQDVILLLTIVSSDPRATVYDDLVIEMNRLNWSATDLQLRSRLRLRT